MNIRNILITSLFFFTLSTNGQEILPPAYSENVKLAEQHHKNQEFLKAAKLYSKAFAIRNDRGLVNHRYDAARSWAMAGINDSAFYQLERTAKSGYFPYWKDITNDADLTALHSDIRWKELIDFLEAEKAKEDKKNAPLVKLLDSVYENDQIYRKQIKQVETMYGKESVEMKNHFKKIAYKDSINLIKVTSFLDQYGWVASNKLGYERNAALFLVIQHADLATQKKYLPMMKEAAEVGSASLPKSAMLEDRIAVQQGEKQIYGSQVGYNVKTGKHYVYPLTDPENVDKRRAEVRMPPIKEYLSTWGINWSIEQYKKDLVENKTQ